MNDKSENNAAQTTNKFRLGCLQLSAIAMGIIFISALLTAWWVKHNIYASKITPTTLNTEEQKVLESKLARLEKSAQKHGAIQKKKPYESTQPLEPEPYTEEDASREISLTERELNALIANQEEIAQKVAIDLSENLVSVKLVVPVDEEILFLGGKTLRLKLGIALSYEKEQPIVVLQGVTLGGIPMPNAWLGYLKHKNLVDEFGSKKGFWKLFADGVEDIKVEEGRIGIRLKD
jgi:hypothetical protein